MHQKTLTSDETVKKEPEGMVLRDRTEVGEEDSGSDSAVEIPAWLINI
jgi:hypothetical protein